MKAAELLVRCLEKEKVRYMFGVPGEENIDVMDALLDSSITFITTRHEQGAAFIAGAMGRLTGRPGVCLATLGPGATNLMTGVADANMDRSPLVAITGQAGLDRQHKESHQYYDVAAMMRPMTKWNASVLTKDIVPEIAAKAFDVAAAEKPGATHIELPEDIAGGDAEGAPLAERPAPLRIAGEADLAGAAALLGGSDRPLLLVGNGVTRQRAAAELRRLAEKLNAPVVHTFMGTGALPADHPLCLFTAGLQQHDHVACGFEDADLVVAVGFDMAEYHPFLWNPKGAKPVLHIDTTPAEIDSCYPVQAGVVGSLPHNLALLEEKLDQRRKADPFPETLRQTILADFAEKRRDSGFPLKPQRIVADLRAALSPDDIAVVDVGAHKMWMARMYPVYQPNTCLISNGFAAMGIALPGAIAAKLVHPERRVVAVVGDGAFQMSMPELETAVRLKLPIVILIWTDGKYGLIEWKQLNKFQRPSHIAFGNPDFVQLARAYGAEGLRIAAADDLQPALRRAFACSGPVVIECPVDDRENVKLTELLGGLVCHS